MNSTKSPFYQSTSGLIFVGFFILYAILGLFGFGNDNDTYRLILSGKNLLENGVYLFSREPGYLIPEIVIGGTAILGGFVLSNLTSALLGAGTLALFHNLIRRIFDPKTAVLTVLIIGLNPNFMIASSSSMDYVYSLFFGMAGVTVLNKKWFYIAALMFAVAISSRLSNALIVGVIYGYFIYQAYKVDMNKEIFRLVLTGVLALGFVAIFFTPSYFAAGGSFTFMTYHIEEWTFLQHLIRFVYKNIFLWGLLPFLFGFGVIVWQFYRKKNQQIEQELVIFGLAIIIIHELLFLKVPLEISYLMPLLFIYVPLIVGRIQEKKILLYSWLALTLMFGFVVSPDVLNPIYDESGVVAIDAEVGIFIHPGKIIVDLMARATSEAVYFETFDISFD